MIVTNIRHAISPAIDMRIVFDDVRLNWRRVGLTRKPFRRDGGGRSSGNRSGGFRFVFLFFLLFFLVGIRIRVSGQRLMFIHNHYSLVPGRRMTVLKVSKREQLRKNLSDLADCLFHLFFIVCFFSFFSMTVWRRY